MKVEHDAKFDRNEMSIGMLRRMCGFTFKDRKTNTELRNHSARRQENALKKLLLFSKKLNYKQLNFPTKLHESREYTSHTIEIMWLKQFFIFKPKNAQKIPRTYRGQQ